VPSGFDSFQRVIEIVTHDDVDKLEARLRWKHYAKAGLTLTRHDLDLQAGSSMNTPPTSHLPSVLFRL
jgi:DNA polymerase-3 subunit chi